MRDAPIPRGTGWKSPGACGQAGRWDREVDHIALQVVSGDSDHPEVRLSAIHSGTSHLTPFTSLCHGLSTGFEHLLLPRAAADVETTIRSLPPTPGF